MREALSLAGVARGLLRAGTEPRRLRQRATQPSVHPLSGLQVVPLTIRPGD